MANISLIRIDSRLIHGQVITKWVKIAKANRIIIIDDELAQDDFMASIGTERDFCGDHQRGRCVKNMGRGPDGKRRAVDPV